MDKCPKCGAEGKHYEFPYLFYYCGTSRCIGNQQSLECQVNQLTRKNAELEAEVQRLRSQLPEGMQDCTIRFKSCPLGHGWLTADNWVQHGCPTCERNNLREAGRELYDEVMPHAYEARRRWAEVDPQ